MVRAVTSPDAPADASRPDRGDEWKYQRFYREAAPRLVTFLVIDGATMREAVRYTQGGLIDAHRRWSLIDNAYRWCRMTVYTRLAHRRDQHTEALSAADVPAGAALIAPERASNDWLRDHRRHDHGLLRALDLLPLLERDAFAWAYDGAGESEIAQALRVAPGTIRDSIRRARTGLEHHLDHREDR